MRGTNLKNSKPLRAPAGQLASSVLVPARFRFRLTSDRSAPNFNASTTYNQCTVVR
jgi:hypothetical protein